MSLLSSTTCGCGKVGALRFDRTLTAGFRALAKTGTYFTLHLAVAVALAYALTGSLVTALAIGLLEPAVQAGVYFAHDRLWSRGAVPAFARDSRWRPYFKTAGYFVVHVVVATGIAYLVSGSWAAAVSIGLLEPFLQIFAFHFHEWLWDGRRRLAVSPMTGASRLS